MSKAVLLDWDGVLSDSLPLYIDLYQRACQIHGKTYPVQNGVEGFKAWYNPRWEQNYYDMGFSEDEFRLVQQLTLETLDYGLAPLFPPVPAMLRSLARDYPLAICSTTPSAMIRTRLRAEGLEDLFTVYTGGDDGCSEKMERVARTLRELGCREGVMVGDTPLDIECGRANGLATVGVTYGWVSSGRVAEAAPDRLVTEPGALEDAIRGLL